jgi:hypothetical protein
MSALSQSIKLNLKNMSPVEQEDTAIDETTSEFCALYSTFLKWVKDTDAKVPSNSDDGEQMARDFRSFVRDANKELFDSVDHYGLPVYETVLAKWDVETA